MRPLALWWLLVGCRSPATETIRPTLADKRAAVDLYWPEAGRPAPLVVVAHGFARSRRRMEGWGTTLSKAGFAVAVPNLPYLAKHHDNAKGVDELIDQLRIAYPKRIGEGLGLVGFSAGGLITAVVSDERSDVDIWVGLDPVDAGGAALDAAGHADAVGVMVFAEPSGCNADGNGRPLVEAWRGPSLSATVVGGTHCDPEQPSNASCALFCGGSEPARAAAFEAVAVDALSAVLHCDSDALSRLDELDARYTDVAGRGLGEAVRVACASGE